MADLNSRVLLQSECCGDVKAKNVTEIIVIRHGETQWNVASKIQGHLDVELNDIGRKQAMEVAARLSMEPRISIVYSSDLKRAYETAETIARNCGGLEVIKDPDLRERHLGDLQGYSLREAAKSRQKAYQAFVSGRKDLEIPGLESENPDDTFNVLEWWKDKEKHFPVLSRMTRDILSIQASTVASESAFSQARLQIGDHRASMRESLEKSVLFRDWIRSERRNFGLAESQPDIDKLMKKC